MARGMIQCTIPSQAIREVGETCFEPSTFMTSLTGRLTWGPNKTVVLSSLPVVVTSFIRYYIKEVSVGRVEQINNS